MKVRHSGVLRLCCYYKSNYNLVEELSGSALQRVEDAGVGEIGQCQRAGNEMLTQKPTRKLRVIKQINNLNSSASQYPNHRTTMHPYEYTLYLVYTYVTL